MTATPRGPATFRQSDLTKGLKAAKKAGVTVERFKIYNDGSVVFIIGGSPLDMPTDPDEAELQRELQSHRKKHGYG
jgi:hypothetical protein